MPRFAAPNMMHGACMPSVTLRLNIAYIVVLHSHRALYALGNATRTPVHLLSVGQLDVHAIKNSKLAFP